MDTGDVECIARTPTHSPRESAANRRCETLPIPLRIATRLDREALAACPSGAAPYQRSRIGFELECRRRLMDALVVKQRIDVVQAAAEVAVECDCIVGNPIVEIAADGIDAIGEKPSMSIAPPCERSRIGEIDNAAFGR